MIELKKVGRLEEVDRSKFLFESDKIALIDADSMLYYCLTADVTFEDAKLKLDLQMFQLLESLETSKYVAFISPKDTFRKKIGFVKPYKGNRNGRKTPPVFYGVQAYARDEWGFIAVPGLEADDCVGLYRDENSVICSPDKDVLKQLVGKHWNYGKNEWVKTSKVDAWRFLWMQSAMGDSVDQIPGIPGMGEKTIDKLLLDVRPEDYPLRILQLYIEKFEKEFGMHEAISRFKETFDLVYMLRNKEELDRIGIQLPPKFILDAKQKLEE
jgi:5'-3' exonuclease